MCETNRIGHIWCKNCLLKHVIEGKIEGKMQVTERRGRRRKQLLHYLQKKKGYLKLQEESLARICGKIAFEGAVDLS
jgi:hypothetical protein